jgi:hypothetical protein
MGQVEMRLLLDLLSMFLAVICQRRMIYRYCQAVFSAFAQAWMKFRCLYPSYESVPQNVG